MAQMVKNLQTQVRSLGWEDPLEKAVAIHSSILALRIPWARRAWLDTVHGVTQRKKIYRLKKLLKEKNLKFK